MRFNPLKAGVVATVATLVMLGADLLLEPSYFTLDFGSPGGFALPLWALSGVYAILQFWIWHNTRRGLSLSNEEVERWGEKLEEATPTILQQYKAKKPVREIAEHVEKQYGIPTHVTLRYIIALGNQAQHGGG